MVMTKTPSVEFVRSAASARDFPKHDRPEVAAVGRSNVGKSRLLNQLTGVKRMAFVSKTPGRTQLINFFRFRVGDEMMLVDLPGYGFAKAPRATRQNWEALVTSYLFEREALCLVLLLIDVRRDPQESDLQVKALLDKARIPYTVVATKADKLSKSQLKRQRTILEEIYATKDGVPLITFSAVTNEGRKELWTVIERHVREARRAQKR